MDPYTLAYLAGDSNFSTTRRYVHPQPEEVRSAMAKAREAQYGHISGHSPQEHLADARGTPYLFL
ncbi:MAG TPA: hypothetical protein VFQ91_10130 [Bryobacteraceae bacterium]|nr:hypothetical protein [Bryobacteraceae bacterium]